MKLSEAQKIAKQVIDRLSPYSERIEIAGSIRRLKPDVGDIELVAVPRTTPILDMFGGVTGEHSLLNDRKLMESLGIVKKSGKRFTQIELYQGINLDLFMVLPPADWAVIYAIRTGPADFSQWLVTPRSKGGALHNGWRCEDGRIHDGQTELKFGEEREFLEWMELGWIEPGERKPEWNRFKKTYLE